MSSVSHVKCPSCSGAVGVTTAQKVVECTYCNAKLLVESETFVPEYFLESNVNGQDARRALQKFLTNDNLPQNLIKNSSFESSTLCFIPYHEFRTRRLGNIEVSVEKIDRSRSSFVDDSYDVNGYSVATSSSPKRITTRDTEVVLRDIYKIEPAIENSEFGLLHTNIFKMTENGSLKMNDLKPFVKKEQAKKGRIFLPVIKTDKFLKELGLTQFSSSVVDETEYVETKIRRIYYPVWRLSYLYEGRRYHGIVDGITGELINARAPQGDKWRVVSLLGTVSFVGYISGKALKLAGFSKLMDGLVNNTDKSGSNLGMIIFMLLFVAGGLVMVHLLAWNQFRYPGEIIKTGGEILVEKYNSFFKQSSKTPVLSPLKTFISYFKGE